MSPVRAQSPASWVDDGNALVYTMRDLNQQTARVFSEIERTGKPAFITRHGRFVAVIRPLSPRPAESRILAEVAREVAARAHGRPANAAPAHQRWSPALSGW
jgi:antitoxin (DNA-binding transcriptional repressor) of toxin-antitoxin stability system